MQLLECLQKCTESKEVVERKLQSLVKKLESNGKELQKVEKKLQIAEKKLTNAQDVLTTVCSAKDNLNYVNHGKPLDAVSSSQRLQKINILKSNIKNALWFFESYGLQPINVIFHDSLGSSVNLELGTNNKDMEKMKEVLFIMDRFKISDQAYHEVATISDTLSKLHSIINIRDNMNNNLEIYRTPGNTPGHMLVYKLNSEK
ncbi:unnamed protein product [Mytilus coruscus]|uniref:Uncharacterized protein n=1 Tax=Mytilus coruscus TaxID=42192 RepID=A0A6J8BD60_MYTCO|nr:unnamed protein product [Mytilus coruscus]